MPKRIRRSPAHRAMDQAVSMLQTCKNCSHLLFQIFVGGTASELFPRRVTAKRPTPIPKNTHREGRKKRGEGAEHQKPKHPKRRTSCLRGVRERQRKLQRKRNNFTRAKQALPAFFLFMAQHRPELQRQNPHQNVVQTVKKLGRMWHKQPEEDKEMYKQEAARLRRIKQRGKSQKQPGKRPTAKKIRAGRRK